MPPLENTKRRFLTGAIAIALALNAPMLLSPLQGVTRLSLFAQIQLGMTAGEAHNKLQDAGISCGLTREGGNECTFSDFWRDYLVRCDPESQRITEKFMWYKRLPTWSVVVHDALRPPR